MASFLFWALHVAIALPLLYGAQELLGRVRCTGSVFTNFANGHGRRLLGQSPLPHLQLALDALFAAPNDSEDTGPVLQLWVSEFASFVFPVMLVWVLLNARALSKLSVPHMNVDDGSSDEARMEISDDEREFWSRMPKPLGRNIVAVSAELHYLRVYTTLGDTLILCSGLAAHLRF